MEKDGVKVDGKKQLCVKLFHCGNVNIANTDDHVEKNIFFMPMGFFPLARVLKENGADVEIIHSDLEYDKDITGIIDFSTLDCVGFDCHWVNQSLSVMETAALIKKIKPDTFIFLGGFTASLFCQEIIKNYPQIDAVIRGDGEVPIAELYRVLRNCGGTVAEREDGLQKVQNLVWRSANNEVMVNDFSYTAATDDMDRLDYAAIEMLRNWEKYRMLCRFHSDFETISSDPLFLMPVGRGCDFACTFCGGNCESQRLMNNRKKTSILSMESAVETIEKAVSYGFKTFFTSFEFEGSDKWYIDVFKCIKQKNININFGYGTWKLPSKNLIDKLSTYCDNVLFEISPETSDMGLRRKNKDTRLFYSNEELEDCLEYMRTKENVKAQLCFGYYLANDTEEAILDTIRYIIELLMKYSGMIEIEYSNFSTDPGSLFFLYPEKYNLDIDVRNLGDYIERLRASYVLKKVKSADMTLFKPKYITAELHSQINAEVKLFHYLFANYRSSVSYLLKKKANPQTLVNIIKESKACFEGLDMPAADKVYRYLIESLKNDKELDAFLLSIIEREYYNQSLKNNMSKPTTLLYLEDKAWEDIEKDDFFEDITGYMQSTAGSSGDDEGEINIEFGF